MEQPHPHTAGGHPPPARRQDHEEGESHEPLHQPPYPPQPSVVGLAGSLASSHSGMATTTNSQVPPTGQYGVGVAHAGGGAVGRRPVPLASGHGRRSWRGAGGAGPVVGGVRAVRNGLAIKEIFLRSQQRGTYVGVERDGSVAANRARAALTAKEAAWTLEIFKVNERAEMELKASRELLDRDFLSAHAQQQPPLSEPPSGGLASSPSFAPAETTEDDVDAFLPTDVDDSELAAENVDVMYYFGFRSASGRYLGLDIVTERTPVPSSQTSAPVPSTTSASASATPHPHHHHHQHHSSYPSYPSSTSSSAGNAAHAPSLPAAGTPASSTFTRSSRSPRSTRVVNASAEEPNFDCLWVCYQIRRGVWGLKSQRGDGPWLGVEGDTGELVLLDEPLPVDARFFWGFTTVRKRIKLISSQGRYLSAELNRTVTANRERAGQWETWTIERLPSNKFTLLGYHGYYLSGLNDGAVCANQGIPRETEQWEFIQIRKGVYSLKSVYSRYLCITPEKDGRVLSQAQSGLKGKRLDEWTVHKDYHLRKITKSLIPLSCVADIPLPAPVNSPPPTPSSHPSGGGAVLGMIRSRKVSFPPTTGSSTRPS